MCRGRFQQTEDQGCVLHARGIASGLVGVPPGAPAALTHSRSVGSCVGGAEAVGLSWHVWDARKHRGPCVDMIAVPCGLLSGLVPVVTVPCAAQCPGRSLKLLTAFAMQLRGW